MHAHCSLLIRPDCWNLCKPLFDFKNSQAIRLLVEIHNIYLERKDPKSALICIEEVERRYLALYDKNSFQMAWVYSHLAVVNALCQNKKEAIGFAQARLAIVSKVDFSDSSISKTPTQMLLKRPKLSRIKSLPASIASSLKKLTSTH